MTTVWSTGSTTPTTDGAREDDVVVRVDGEEVAFGRVRGADVAWLAETVAASVLPAGSLADVEAGGSGLTAVPEQAALQIAAEGMESALSEQGG